MSLETYFLIHKSTEVSNLFDAFLISLVNLKINRRFKTLFNKFRIHTITLNLLNNKMFKLKLINKTVMFRMSLMKLIILDKCFDIFRLSHISHLRTGILNLNLIEELGTLNAYVFVVIIGLHE